MSEELAIDVHGMTKRFGARTVVNDISLQVKDAQTQCTCRQEIQDGDESFIILRRA